MFTELNVPPFFMASVIQVFSALLFLYRKMLGLDLPWPDNVVRIAGVATPRALRNLFAAHFLESVYDIRTVQKLLGHSGIFPPR